ncbi:MAG: tRNA (N(6)-L-threonylcarbamoyladenosine(37)-C(2))-methylthiotransferase MtaB [Cytophagales bacterium]|nr:MAG: tRNA (N(6)-L-threonylcarbamoyladenosine(37)-C(2))-methylthiotransferase MtaB [Cytophagales bacterium]TAF60870.1 MAG: tRNA (N(6)-L-threonylcarbamoyladenosine(37)-C(2))-methylthiotransferase MtaB [Cytophagales bacterium]
MRKVAFHTLGCKLNFSETSTLGRMFEERGYARVEEHENPDVLVLNTCSVTDNADKKCRQIIRQFRTQSPQAYVVVVGCYAQLKPQEIADIPGVNAVLGAAEKFRIFDVLNTFEKDSTVQVCASEISQANTFTAAYSLADRTRTFLKVQDGCDYHCSFCTIPLARGASRSDTIDNVLRAARKIAESGTKEIVLTGVNTGDFGLIEGQRLYHFYDLVQALEQDTPIERIRISSIEPNLLTDELIDFVAQSKKFMPHFHVPLQSGSDKILKFMRRKYLSELYKSRVERIKSRMPLACIGVDVIVGFPNESQEDFLDTYHFLNSLPVSYLHVFPYSERANTRAADMENTVTATQKKERAAMLGILSEKKKRFFYEQNLGLVHSVLWENAPKNGLLEGFTQNYVRLSTPYRPELPNTTQNVLVEAERFMFQMV